MSFLDMVWRDKDHVLAYHPTSIGGLVGVGGIYVGLPKRLGKILEEGNQPTNPVG